MLNSTKLSFIVLSTNSIKTIGIADTSYYNVSQGIDGATLQIITPFSSKVVELDYNRNAITILNSNNLGITNVTRTEDLADLPDGIYTAKISLCPFDQFWFERTWYRTTQLECKYDQALLKLNISECEKCYNPEKLKVLQRVALYIQGIKANTEVKNMKEANNLYIASNKLLTKLLECEECFDKFNNGRGYTLQ